MSGPSTDPRAPVVGATAPRRRGTELALLGFAVLITVVAQCIVDLTITGALRAEMATFDFATLPPEVAGAALVRVIAEPTPVEAATIGAMQHGDGMGSATAKHLARFSSSAIDPQRIVADYGRAYWKRGLLAQRSAQAMVLRNLLWLAGAA